MSAARSQKKINNKGHFWQRLTLFVRVWLSGFICYLFVRLEILDTAQQSVGDR